MFGLQQNSFFNSHPKQCYFHCIALPDPNERPAVVLKYPHNVNKPTYSRNNQYDRRLFVSRIPSYVLSLSSRRQNEALGSRRQSAPLDRDQPMDFACIRCCRIHRSTVAEWPSKLSPQRRMCNLFATYRGFLHYNGSQYQVRFEHIQQALKEHLYGTGRGLLLEEAFSHTEINLNLPKLPHFTCMNLVSIEARVVTVNQKIVLLESSTLVVSIGYVYLPISKHRSEYGYVSM